MSKLSNRKKLMAWVLNRDEDFGYSQRKIANLMDVSQSTISHAVEKVEHWKQVEDLTQQLEDARARLAALGYEPDDSLPPYNPEK